MDEVALVPCSSQSACQDLEPEATVARMVRHLSVVALLPRPPAPRRRPRSRKLAAVNPTGTVIAVNQQSDSVTLIDLKTMEAYRHVPVVGGPHEAAASPDGRSVVVTNYNKPGVGQQKTLSVLALPSGDTIKTIDLGEYRAPHDVRWVDPTQVVVRGFAARSNACACRSDRTSPSRSCRRPTRCGRAAGPDSAPD